MTWVYRNLIRPALFTQDSETIHNRTLAALSFASHKETLCEALAAFYAAVPLPIEAFGLHFPNPVGLAAGMDKHGAAVPAWASLGFGFAEIGGVTWHAQAGSSSPRMFRALKDEALINRMGFNNPGAPVLATRLAEWRALERWPKHPVGINLGKSKITPLNQATGDYANSFRVLWPHADFFVVNVSSPNTPNLRQLQDKAALDEILAMLQEVNAQCSASRVQFSVEASTPAGKRTVIHSRNPKPILVKVAPDLSFQALDEILELTGPRRVAGIVATNTTITRPGATDPELRRIYAEAGGLSGRPLCARSTEVIAHLFRQTAGRLPIIGVGGISTAADAWEKICAGATLIQIYTGLVYEGPGVVRAIVQGLQERLQERGLSDLAQAVGSGH